MYKQISTIVPILLIFDRIFKQNFNCVDKLVQNIDWRYVPQCVLKNATEYNRYFDLYIYIYLRKKQFLFYSQEFLLFFV